MSGFLLYVRQARWTNRYVVWKMARLMVMLKMEKETTP